MLKLLFVGLISCTIILASPIDRSNKWKEVSLEDSLEESLEESSDESPDESNSYEESPFDRVNRWRKESLEDISNESNSYEIFPPKLAFLRDRFGNSYSKIGDIITCMLKDVFIDVERKLDSKKFRESVNSLKHISEKIFNTNNELKGDGVTGKIIEKQLDAVSKSFEKMFARAIKYMMKRNNRKVDASHFKFAVDTLITSVDKLYK